MISRIGLPTWRLVLDPPRDPFWNMAVDEALLRGTTVPPADFPTLRLYGWDPPAVSLGRFQPPLPPPGKRFCRTAGFAIVRRPTGGGGVLHVQEVTYSVSAPLGKDPFPRSVVRIYQRIAAALQRGLRRLGVVTEARLGCPPCSPRSFSDPCFARIGRWEVCWRGKKMLGSAQARHGERFLQHGSIPMRMDPELLLQAFGGNPDLEGTFPATSLKEAMGREPCREEVTDALVRGFQEEFRIRFFHQALTRDELHLSQRIRQAKEKNVSEW